MYWIDAHAHISFFPESVLGPMMADARRLDLRFWIMAGYDASDWKAQVALAQKYPDSVATVFGLHPWRVMEMSGNEIEADMATLAQMLPQAKALGETGIDKFKTQDLHVVNRQIALFERHLELNKTHNLPLVLHVVRAENEALSVLKNYSYSGVVHGFSGSFETAKRFVDLGYKISVGRGAYRKGYKQLKECVIKLSMDDILLESDAALDDDGAPENAVSVYFEVVAAVAELKKMSQVELMKQNFLNVKKVFGI